MEPLRQALQGAINQRDASLRNGRCQRTDYDQIRVSIGRAQVFLNGYPVATDEQVREWCLAHWLDVRRIVPKNADGTFDRLMYEPLHTRSEAA